MTLALNDEDVEKVIASMYGNKGADRFKYFDYPSSVYSTLPYDAVTFEGRPVGISSWIGDSSKAISTRRFCIVVSRPRV